MNFRPEMVLAIRRGKCETRRVANDNPNSPWFRGQCGYRMPDRTRREQPKTYALCPGRGKAAVGKLRLTSEPELKTVGNITDYGAEREGFESRDAFLDYFLKLNPKAKLSTEVWVVRFVVVDWDEAAILRMIAEMEKAAA